MDKEKLIETLLDTLRNNPQKILWILALSFFILFIIKLIFGRKKIKPVAPAPTDLLERQAVIRSGKVTEDADGSRALTFSYRNSIIRVVLNKGKGTINTAVIFDTETSSVPSVFINAPLPQGVPEVPKTITNSYIFDNEFVIKCKDKDFIQKFITQDIKQSLLEFKRAFDSARVSIYKSQFCLSVMGIPQTEADYSKLITLALILYDRLKIVEHTSSDTKPE